MYCVKITTWNPLKLSGILTRESDWSEQKWDNGGALGAPGPGIYKIYKLAVGCPRLCLTLGTMGSRNNQNYGQFTSKYKAAHRGSPVMYWAFTCILCLRKWVFIYVRWYAIVLLIWSQNLIDEDFTFRPGSRQTISSASVWTAPACSCSATRSRVYHRAGLRDDKKLIKDVIIRAGPLPSVSEFELFHWILNLIFFVSHSLIIKTPEEYLDKMYTSGFKKLKLVMSTEQER